MSTGIYEGLDTDTIADLHIGDPFRYRYISMGMWKEVDQLVYHERE